MTVPPSLTNIVMAFTSVVDNIQIILLLPDMPYLLFMILGLSKEALYKQCFSFDFSILLCFCHFFWVRILQLNSVKMF